MDNTYDENLVQRLKTVCFTGHRTIPAGDELEALTGRLDALILASYKKGYRTFIAGGAVGFDTLAACRVIAAKETMPDISLHLALPCRNQTEKWTSLEDLTTYKKILGASDHVDYMTVFYTDSCMHERNRFMVDRSALCIAYCKRQRGGSAYTVNYAKKQGLGVLNICDGKFSIDEFDRFSLKEN